MRVAAVQDAELSMGAAQRRLRIAMELTCSSIFIGQLQILSLCCSNAWHFASRTDRTRRVLQPSYNNDGDKLPTTRCRKDRGCWRGKGEFESERHRQEEEAGPEDQGAPSARRVLLERPHRALRGSGYPAASLRHAHVRNSSLECRLDVLSDDCSWLLGPVNPCRPSIPR
jgi:hypothetical protein